MSLSLDLALIGAVGAASLAFGVTVVTGGSMEPALSRGDLVLYRKGPGTPRPGDVVLLGAAGHRYVHRVVSVSRRGMLVTRGDANPIPDLTPTPVAGVRGTVLAQLHLGRLVARLATSARHARLWSQSNTER